MTEQDIIITLVQTDIAWQASAVNLQKCDDLLKSVSVRHTKTLPGDCHVNH